MGIVINRIVHMVFYELKSLNC